MHLAGVGGAFGGREDLSIQIHAAMLALHADRPVKIVYNREESFTGHVHRHPAKIWAEHRATRDGRVVCVHMRILVDGGAYASSSTAVISNASAFALGPYRVDNALIEGTAVYTNNPPCGAMRGFGAVQVCFAAEAQMDRLAEALGIDPIELRLLNAIESGDTLPTGQVLTGSLPVAEVIRAAAAIPVPEAEALPRDPIRLPGGAGNTTRGEGVQRGVGFAVGFKNICFSEGFDDYCAARVQIHVDGSATVHCAGVEVGQGLVGVILQVAEAELGTSEITLATSTTSTVDSAGSTSASRMTWMAAGAVRDACRAAVEERAVREGGEVDVERIYRHAPTFPLDPENGQVLGERAHVSLATCAMRVVAEVDVDLGLTRLVWIGAAQDVGKALNTQSITGQIEGGTAQGIGLALMEEIQTRDGRITNASFTDYLLPTALDMPPVESVLIEDPEPDAPYGVKGVGEPPTVVSTAAVVAAMRAATGRPLHRVPVRPGRDLPFQGPGERLKLSTERRDHRFRPPRHLSPDHDGDRGQDHRRAGGDLPGDHLVEEEDAERDRDERVHVRVGGDGAERHVGDEPDVGRVAEDRAEHDQVEQAEERAGRPVGRVVRLAVRQRHAERDQQQPAREALDAGRRERVARHRQPRGEERPDRPGERGGDDEEHARDAGIAARAAGGGRRRRIRPRSRRGRPAVAGRRCSSGGRRARAAPRRRSARRARSARGARRRTAARCRRSGGSRRGRSSRPAPSPA